MLRLLKQVGPIIALLATGCASRQTVQAHVTFKTLPYEVTATVAVAPTIQR